ncbi:MULTISPECIES: hypothetical protein [unclassified Aeromicrobium]|uniref:hypothetical protein n=1 Tax=unclassified Aeromicrobium TaxID=2633570 RepID=UPI00396B26C9
MTTGSVVRAAAQLALLYAAIGVAGTLLLALLAGDLTADLLLPLAVLVVALALAAAVIVVLARLAVSWLEGRVREPVVVAIMVASGVVLLSGVLTVSSLGVLSVAVSALMALATHVVLTRCWA